MLTKTKKIHKNLNIENFGKKMVLRYGGESYSQNLSLWMTDACAMTVAMLTKSSRAKNCFSRKYV